jgi:hypothetical protein
MPQYDFGNLSSPLSGTTFFNTHLEPWRDAVHSSHSGATRPSYAAAGMIWVDTSATPRILKYFDGTDDIVIGYLDHTGNLFTPYSAAYSDAIHLAAGSADNTKKVRMEVDGITTGTTRVITVPDFDLTLVGVDSTQTLTNKSLSDSTSYIVDNSDNTKKAQFQASGISTGTTRTYTLPNADGTIALLSDISGGDVVKVAEGTVSSASNLYLTNLFSSTYLRYDITLMNVVPASVGDLRCRVGTGGSSITSSTYDRGGAGRDSEGNPVPAEAESAAYVSLTAGDSMKTTSTNGAGFILECLEPSAASRCGFFWKGRWEQDGTTRFRNVFGDFSNQSTSAIQDIEFYFNSINISSLKYRVYGYK